VEPRILVQVDKGICERSEQNPRCRLPNGDPLDAHRDYFPIADYPQVTGPILRE
jgi:hypothetical protein